MASNEGLQDIADHPGADQPTTSDSDAKLATTEDEKKSTIGKKSKKSKDKGKASDEGTSGEKAPSMADLKSLQKAMELMSANQRPAKSTAEAASKTFKFWDTQPVPKLDESPTQCGAIEADKDDVRKNSYSLPPGFVWDTLDLEDAAQLKELYELLSGNYVEDDDNMFRFNYSPEFLIWALKPPGYKKNWHCGVRVETSRKLVSFISGVPAHMRAHDDLNEVLVEINFLCVHKKLRSKRVAPVLIKEITRRVHLEGIFKAVFTAGIVIPKPIATCRYWHRSLNPKKLIDIKFSQLGRNMTMQRTIKLYRLPQETKVPGLRLIQAKDVPVACKKLNEYLSRFQLAPVFNEDEFKHWFLPVEGVVTSYVVEDSEGDITDMFSYYSLPSSIINNPTYNQLSAAYLFYTFHTKTPLQDLIQDALIIAKNANFDVMNALDLMENKQFLENLKFGIGDGNLQYYFYNYRCPAMESEKIGLVLQ
ncbi:Glycylpeptide N-tetradecanoyltransferase 2 [Trichoplax sp. H2]|nr:Glycylpeptide N-tetradecanoyltransferase 2 [Trichoplax sp. H2]|eukprot:RDD40200.1 Glycylpeptide N-tetradecanoyltransferase 2 [Trichoplax sp. H2]